MKNSTLNQTGRKAPNNNGNYKLIWSDECSADGSIDTTKWFHEIKLPPPNSWHNVEIQHYTYDPEIKNEKIWPFDKDLHILLNVAILPSISKDFTESPMIINYVRVYQN